MKKTFNRVTAALGMPVTLFWLLIWKIAGNKTETTFHINFFLYLVAVVKTGLTSPSQNNRRVYP